MDNTYLTGARDLANGLDVLVEMQKQVSSPVPGAIPTGSDWPTKDAVRTYTLAMIVEIAEWVQTLDYKPWKNSAPDAYPVLSDTVADEFADILAFLGILTITWDSGVLIPKQLPQHTCGRALRMFGALLKTLERNKMDRELDEIRRAIYSFGWGGLTQEQKEDIRFRLLMGQSMKSVAELYKISIARVHEVKNWVR